MLLDIVDCLPMQRILDGHSNADDMDTVYDESEEMRSCRIWME